MRTKRLIMWLAGILIGVFLAYFITPPEYYAKLGSAFKRIAVEKYRKQKTASSRLKLAKLYIDLGEYDASYEILSALDTQESKRITAILLFKSSKFTEALSEFEKIGEYPDGEYLYYYALTCEKHNLYDKAEQLYNKITDSEFKNKAFERLSSLRHSVYENADSYILDMIKNSPGQDEYPEAGALILSIKEEQEISENNTSVYAVHMIIKVLNDRGKEDFSEVLLGYDSTYEKVELEFARTIKPDGTAVQVGDKNIRDVSRYLNFPLYSNARVKIISMPEVAPGAIIEYKAKIYSSKLVAERHFSTNYFLQESDPVLFSSFKLVVPPGRKLNSKILNSQYNRQGIDITPQVKNEDGKLVYFLQVENVEQIIPEPLMPPKAEVDTAFLISSFNSWDEIFSWWSPLYKDKIVADEYIKAKVEELTAEEDSSLDKARAIYNFCAQEIRYVAVEYGQAGYEPHKASEVFLNKYGDCKDQAILLVTMLRYAGLEAYPVLIGTKGTIALMEDFPMMPFNHAIAVLKINDEFTPPFPATEKTTGQERAGFIFLDPTAETVPLGDLPLSDQGRKVLVFLNDEYRIMETPDFGSEHNRVQFDTYIKINNDESISARRSVKSSGVFEQGQRYWLIYSLPSIIEEGIRNRVQEFSPNGRLIDYKVENARDLNKQVIFNYSFSGDDFLIKAGKARVVPAVWNSVDVSSVVKDERIYPLDLASLNKIIDNLELELPESYRFKYVPESVRIDNQWLTYSLEYALEGNTLKCTSEQIIKKEYIFSQEYAEYKNFLENLARRLNQAIIIELR
ncbi:MAG: hypothetical protein COV72_07930 [Candidatus Omnitrophica bacterium CG11_big_fil_rev_8_21_14_0_20_42_13]|uniref:Transglutaminase-like domain-containing protein n=1 Tax=Candidatus Ghiorseimicrobium undicola TaxID=1974746 RepID=A0A2H0LW09_9BACT|nr:MAG: hypothetical protein COV72_07930 [Candidatus Omnitrophica bacterium CG11_big_fil_rev_8_21_14_0_20_42_13]